MMHIDEHYKHEPANPAYATRYDSSWTGYSVPIFYTVSKILTGKLVVNEKRPVNTMPTHAFFYIMLHEGHPKGSGNGEKRCLDSLPPDTGSETYTPRAQQVNSRLYPPSRVPGPGS